MEFKIANIRDFNLDHIFDCGQCFRWEKQADGSYTGVAMGKIVNMQFAEDPLSGGTLRIDNCDEVDFQRIWRPYLDLELDYGKLKETLRHSDKTGTMAQAIVYGEGIRILKQDLWETLISFIISQNNNIPRIKGCIEKLSKLLGEPAGEYDGKIYYSLPTPEALAAADIETLEPVKLGYRAKYLIDTAKKVVEEGFIRENLGEYMGVGPKVESCIELFGRHNLAAFPIDVWVKRVMSRLYGFEEKDVKGMADFAKETFGDLGGVAQQYLFYYIRGLDGITKSS